MHLARHVGTGDFNADGKWDILWRDTGGNVAIWLMNGTTVLNPITAGVGNVPTTWSIVGTGDFNADGKSNILWHDTSGNVAVWEMNGTTILNPNAAGVGNVPTSFTIAGSGDFNGDGKSDIMWRDNSGNIAIWEMNGTTVLNPNTAGVGDIPAVWTIQDALAVKALQAVLGKGSPLRSLEQSSECFRRADLHKLWAVDATSFVIMKRAISAYIHVRSSLCRSRVQAGDVAANMSAACLRGYSPCLFDRSGFAGRSPRTIPISEVVLRLRQCPPFWLLEMDRVVGPNPPSWCSTPKLQRRYATNL